MAYISGNSAAFFAFNIWDTESARAVIDAGEAMGRDVILQTSSAIFAITTAQKPATHSWMRRWH